jgi:hypothetical protein
VISVIILPGYESFVKATLVISCGLLALVFPPSWPPLIVLFTVYTLYTVGRIDKEGVNVYLDRQFAGVPRTVGLLAALPSIPAIVLLLMNGRH